MKVFGIKLKTVHRKDENGKDLYFHRQSMFGRGHLGMERFRQIAATPTGQMNTYRASHDFQQIR